MVNNTITVCDFSTNKPITVRSKADVEAYKTSNPRLYNYLKQDPNYENLPDWGLSLTGEQQTQEQSEAAGQRKDAANAEVAELKDAGMTYAKICEQRAARAKGLSESATAEDVQALVNSEKKGNLNYQIESAVIDPNAIIDSIEERKKSGKLTKSEEKVADKLEERAVRTDKVEDVFVGSRSAYKKLDGSKTKIDQKTGVEYKSVTRLSNKEFDGLVVAQEKAQKIIEQAKQNFQALEKKYNEAVSKADKEDISARMEKEVMIFLSKYPEANMVEYKKDSKGNITNRKVNVENYKAAMRGYTGSNFNAELSERKNLRMATGKGKRSDRHMFRAAGLDFDWDYTTAIKVGTVVLGTSLGALSVALGSRAVAIAKAFVDKGVTFTSSEGESFTHRIYGEDSQVATAGKRISDYMKGAGAGLITSLAGAAFAKQPDKKDALKNREFIDALNDPTKVRKSSRKFIERLAAAVKAGTLTEPQAQGMYEWAKAKTANNPLTKEEAAALDYALDTILKNIEKNNEGYAEATNDTPPKTTASTETPAATTAPTETPAATPAPTETPAATPETNQIKPIIHEDTITETNYTWKGRYTGPSQLISTVYGYSGKGWNLFWTAICEANGWDPNHRDHRVGQRMYLPPELEVNGQKYTADLNKQVKDGKKGGKGHIPVGDSRRTTTQYGLKQEHDPNNPGPHSTDKAAMEKMSIEAQKRRK